MILIGCLGLIDTGHQLSADVAILCAEAACLLGLTLALRRGFLGALALALGSAALMLSASLVELVLLWMTAAMLPAFRGWRSRQYVKTITIALALGAPLVLMWPMSMAKHQPELFAQWWHSLALGPVYGFGRFALLHDFGYYLRLLPWFAWPAWPLAPGRSGVVGSGLSSTPLSAAAGAGADEPADADAVAPSEPGLAHCRYRCRWPYWLPWNWTPSNVAPLRSLTGSVFSLWGWPVCWSGWAGRR